MSVGKRILVVLTVLWNLIALTIAGESYRYDWVLYIQSGLMPTVFFWGLYWIILGFFKPKSE